MAHQEEAGPSNNMGNNHCCDRRVDELIFSVIKFFSVEENFVWNKIQTELLPNLIANSNAFQKGLKADLTRFKNANEFQLKFLYKCFRFATTLIVDELFRDDRLLQYILNFKQLQRLQITIYEHDNILTRGISLPITILKIISNSPHNWHDSIDLLLQCSPELHKFSMRGGRLSIQTIIKLNNFKFKSICLNNVLLIKEHKNALLNVIRHNRELNELKLISYYDETTAPFNEIVHEFLNIFDTPHNLLEKLAFSVRYDGDQHFKNLKKLVALKYLKIYYSVHQSNTNILSLLTTLRHMPETKLKFIEYYKKPTPGTEHTPDTLSQLKNRKKYYLALFKENFPDAEVIICNDY